MSTLIEYRYRDASNNHVDTAVVLNGTLSQRQIADIAKCLHDNEYFIPSQVGLPENRFDTYHEQDDHVWFELYPFNTFDTVTAEPTESISVHQVYANFMAAKDHWDEDAAMKRLTGNAAIAKTAKSAADKPISIMDYMKTIKGIHQVTTVTLAQATGLEYKTLADIETGKQPPTYEQLITISKTLNLSTDETGRMFDVFGKAWNQFGIPLDIVHYIKTEPDAIRNIRGLFKPEDRLSAAEIELVDRKVSTLFQQHDPLLSRAINAMFYARLNTLGQVVYAQHMNPTAFAAIRSMGTKSRERLNEILKELGLYNINITLLEKHLRSTDQMNTYFFKHSLDIKP